MHAEFLLHVRRCDMVYIRKLRGAILDATAEATEVELPEVLQLNWVRLEEPERAAAAFAKRRGHGFGIKPCSGTSAAP